MSARKLSQLGVGDWIALASLLTAILGGVIHLHARVGKLEGSVDILKTLVTPRGTAATWQDESGNELRVPEKELPQTSALSDRPVLGIRRSELRAIWAGLVERHRARNSRTPPRAATDTAGKNTREPSCNDTRFACGVERPVAQPPPNAQTTSSQ